MNDEQIVLALISAYKRNGIDLSYILDDPIFVKLPIASKVSAIQKYAGLIQEGISPGLTRADKKNILINSLFTGAGAASAGMAVGAGLAKFSRGGVTPLIGAITGAIMGGAVGAGGGALRSLENVSARRSLKDSLQQTSIDPTPVNAISTLSNSHMCAADRDANNKLLNKLDEIMTERSKDQVKRVLNKNHHIMLGIRQP